MDCKGVYSYHNLNGSCKDVYQYYTDKPGIKTGLIKTNRNNEPLFRSPNLQNLLFKCLITPATFVGSKSRVTLV